METLLMVEGPLTCCPNHFLQYGYYTVTLLSKQATMQFFILDWRRKYEKACQFLLHHNICFPQLNLYTPINNQDEISCYNINTVSWRQVMRIKKNISEGINY